MAVILYPSGVTETYEPKGHTFLDDEILKIFKDYLDIRTARLYEVPNTWCVWGENEEADDSDFNKLGADILQEDVFCPVLFIHDTEIDPAWMLTDNVILKGYEDFKRELLEFFDHIAENVIRQTQQMREQQGTQNLIFLTTIGPTEDKRVMFEFDPHKQSEEFWKEEFFLTFSYKVREFLNVNYKDDQTFFIFQDKKSIIYTPDEHVDFLMNKIINLFEKKEKYEYCSELKKVLDKWKKFKKDNPLPKRRKKKDK